MSEAAALAIPMPVLPELAPLLAAINARPKEPQSPDPAERRRLVHEAHANGSPYAVFAEPFHDVAEVFDTEIPVRHPGGSIRVRVYRPETVSGGAVVYLHGGGWFMGRLEDGEARSRAFAAGAGVVVVNVEYRLAPEFRFPTGLEDAYAALQWTVAQADALGFDGSRIGVAGESAGANLAAAVCLLARGRGGPAISLQVLEIPCLDVTMTAPSVTTYAEGFVLSKDELEWIQGVYLGDHDPTDPLASPLFAADLSRLPPAFIASAQCDPLADDARRYASRLGNAGVDVTHVEWAGHVHGSQILTALIPSSREWREAAVAAVHRYLAD